MGQLTAKAALAYRVEGLGLAYQDSVFCAECGVPAWHLADPAAVIVTLADPKDLIDRNGENEGRGTLCAECGRTLEP